MKKWLSILMMMIAVSLLAVFYVFGYRNGYKIDADQAFYIRTAQDILEGNVLLKGWTCSYWSSPTADFLWVSILRLFTSQEFVLYVLGPISYALTVLFSFLLIKEATPEVRNHFILVLLLPMILIPDPLRYWMLSVGAHGIPVLYIVMLFWLTEKLLKESVKPIWYVVYFLFLALGSINDEWPVFFFALPLMAVLAIEVFFKPSRKHALILEVSALGVVAERLLIKVIPAMGGMQINPYAKTLINVKEIGDYFLGLLLAIADIFRADFSGKYLFSVGFVVNVIGIVVLLQLLLVFFWNIFRWNQTSLLDKAIVFGALFCAGSYWLSGVSKDPFEINSRYLAPFFFLSIITLARWKVKHPFPCKRYEIAFILPLIMFSLNNFPRSFVFSPTQDERLKQIAECLVEKGVTHAYTTYWESHSIWHYSDGKVESAPVLEAIYDDAKEIHPMSILKKAEWYDQSFNADCLVVDRNYNYGIDEDIVISVFGDFKEHIVIKQTDIYFFDQNLSEKITH